MENWYPNISDNGTFLPSISSILLNGSGGRVIVNGANTFFGNIILSANDFALNFNANQSLMGLISMGDSLKQEDITLELSISNSVSELKFTDNSNSNWDNLSLKILGFKDNVISLRNRR